MPLSSLLSVKNLRVAVEDKEIVRGVSLEICPGEVHALMGPNGSGKSTFANVIMGHPGYTVTGGTVVFQGKNLLSMRPDERAKEGLFLAFQYPREISGVTLRSFLFAAAKAQGKATNSLTFRKELYEYMRRLKIDEQFSERFVNQGFSGGEKKKAEILQLAVLRPRLAILDETDSGLDIDALKIVADGINSMRSARPGNPVLRYSGTPFTALVVTHYARILQYLKPDRVYVMVRGKIVESGGPELAERLEREGYKRYGVREGIEG
jgi:Fe-S cluster assembly ATP-binding protein